MKFTGGLPETECGAGSTLAATEYLRSRLPGVLDRLGIRLLIDAPCGDLNWMRLIEVPYYIGLDLNPDHIKKARQYRQSIFSWDIVETPLPHGDAIISRDFIQHLPTEKVMTFLKNIRRSEIEWLMITSHSNPVNGDIRDAGDYRPINLLAEPFNFPPPIISIMDPPGSDRILGVWNKNSLWRRS